MENDPISIPFPNLNPLQAMMRRMDRDGDGRVNQNEFVDYFDETLTKDETEGSTDDRNPINNHDPL